LKAENIKFTKKAEAEMDNIIAQGNKSSGLIGGLSLGQIMFITSLVLQLVTLAINAYEQWAAEQRVREKEKIRQELRFEFDKKLRENSKNFRGRFNSGVPV
jgi:hypothetical protein